MSPLGLEKELVEAGYRHLFLRGEKSLADYIWQNGKNQRELKSIIKNPKSSLYAKFLAAELIRHFRLELDPKWYGILAEAYAYALANTSADKGNIIHLNGNLWGLLYEENDTGYLGQQFIKFGDEAFPYLMNLLDDSDGKILYEGSEEATIGNAYQYRIKDFAAFYLSKIKNIPIKFHQDFEKRDKEIEQLKMRLRNG